ncbi:MAG: methyl-accepting chemotaxis protein [Zoogloeaceae bacterium]|nr:methyl-accepting chemotaxis protein [Zoogloeaceae bacterium]
MNLENLKIKTRLRIQVSLAFVGLFVLVVFALLNQRASLLEDRKEKVVELVQSFYTTIEYLDKEVAAGRMSLEEAQDDARSFVRGAHYGEGNRNYMFVVDKSSNYVVFPPEPAAEGVNVPAVRNNAGRMDILNHIVAAGQSSPDGGFYNYSWPKPPDTTPIPKITFARYYAPWNWTIITGIYVDDVDAAFQKELILLFMIASAVLASLLAFGFLIERGIHRKLGGEVDDVAASARAIAEGDLTRAIPVEWRGSLAESLAQAQRELQRVIVKVSDMAGILVAKTGALNKSTEAIGLSTSKQSNAAANTAAAVLQLSASIDKVSKSAADSEHNAVKGSEVCAHGVSVGQQAQDGIFEISQTVQTSAAQIGMLLQKSEEIGKIANVIREIADQTNLLALNAAIEAARAGEQGRGFAVVADEVRKLAERTTAATSEIGGMIQSIQSETQGAVVSMNSTKPRVEEELALISELRDMLDGVSREASSSLAAARQVSDELKAQTHAIEEISKNVETSVSFSEETDAAVKKDADAVRELDNMAAELKQCLAFFKV